MRWLPPCSRAANAQEGQAERFLPIAQQSYYSGARAPVFDKRCRSERTPACSGTQASSSTSPTPIVAAIFQALRDAQGRLPYVFLFIAMSGRFYKTVLKLESRFIGAAVWHHWWCLTPIRPIQECCRRLSVALFVWETHGAEHASALGRSTGPVRQPKAGQANCHKGMELSPRCNPFVQSSVRISSQRQTLVEKQTRRPTPS